MPYAGRTVKSRTGLFASFYSVYGKRRVADYWYLMIVKDNTFIRLQTQPEKAGFLPPGPSEIAPRVLFSFQGLEEGFEIAFAEAFGPFALDDLKK